jgi:hypothetical protein
MRIRYSPTTLLYGVSTQVMMMKTPNHYNVAALDTTRNSVGIDCIDTCMLPI